MIIKTAEELKNIATTIFDAAGSPNDQSQWVAETLVRSNLAGYDSHGVMRISFYVERILNGELCPGAPIEIQRETSTTAVLNGNQGWGQVLARDAMQMAIEKASKNSLAAVAVSSAQHCGRAGEYVAMAAEAGMIGLAFVNSRGNMGQMVPWGGIERRLKLCPMAFAAPAGSDQPSVLVDVTMSVSSGGKIHHAEKAGEQLPEGYIIDADGNPTTDPGDYDGPPPGALLPLGGIVGHKGYALNIMVDLIAGALTGAGVSGQDTPTGNGILMMAIRIDDFVDTEEFVAAVEELRAWVKSSKKKPGVDEIIYPGEIEADSIARIEKDGIVVPPGIWKEILDTAEKVDVKL